MTLSHTGTKAKNRVSHCGKQEEKPSQATAFSIYFNLSLKFGLDNRLAYHAVISRNADNVNASIETRKIDLNRLDISRFGIVNHLT